MSWQGASCFESFPFVPPVRYATPAPGSRKCLKIMQKSNHFSKKITKNLNDNVPNFCKKCAESH